MKPASTLLVVLSFGFLSSSLSAQPANEAIQIVQSSLKSDSARRQRLALILIPTLKLTPAESGVLIRSLIEFAPQAKTDEVIIPWLDAYGKLFLKPEDQTISDRWPAAFATFPTAKENVERLTPFLSREPKAYSIPVQRAAARTVQNLVMATIQKLDERRSFSIDDRSRLRDLLPEEHLAIGIATHPLTPIYPALTLFNGPIEEFTASIHQYVPLVKKLLELSDNEGRRSALDTVRSLAQSVSKNFPDPSIKTEQTIKVRPDEEKIKWLLFDSVVQDLNRLLPLPSDLFQSESIDLIIQSQRTIESMANARRLILINRDYEVTPGAPIVQLPKLDSLFAGLDQSRNQLVGNLTAKDNKVRLTAMEALENYNEASWPSRTAIFSASRDESVFVRWVAVRSIGKMIPKDAPAKDVSESLSILTERLQDPDIDVRVTSMIALQNLGDRASSATGAVAPFVSKGDIDSRLQAILTLESINAEATQAAPALGEALSQEDYRIRRSAAMALYRMGPKAKNALPALEKALSDTDLEVRRLVSEAILEIEK